MTGPRARGGPAAATRPARRVLLTIPQVAREFGIAESILYRWAAAGELAGASRQLGRWYVKRVPFERWLTGGEAPRADRARDGEDAG